MALATILKQHKARSMQLPNSQGYQVHRGGDPPISELKALHLIAEDGSPVAPARTDKQRQHISSIAHFPGTVDMIHVCIAGVTR